ncbi:hypothetical protein [Butyrivibrio fibrisolvens]|uniref:hypothetical protein n=1 Tax=Butyrivibrio fibrisolvens TaxID=831 RepID=UPI0003B72C49|nr:hypothetical protein [Butyrivibrio fibrisolvens]
MLSFYLCRGDETVASMLERINKEDTDGITYVCDEVSDHCFINDDKFVHADKIINYHNEYWAVHAVGKDQN